MDTETSTAESHPNKHPELNKWLKETSNKDVIAVIGVSVERLNQMLQKGTLLPQNSGDKKERYFFNYMPSDLEPEDEELSRFVASRDYIKEMDNNESAESSKNYAVTAAVVDRARALFAGKNLPLNISRSDVAYLAYEVAENKKEMLEDLDDSGIYLDESDFVEGRKSEFSKKALRELPIKEVREIMDDITSRRGVLIYLNRGLLNHGRISDYYEDDRELVIESDNPIELSDVVSIVEPLSDVDKLALLSV